MDHKKGTDQLCPPANAKVITKRSATSWIDDSGIVIILAKGNQTLEHAKENMEALQELSGGKKMAVLIDYTNILSISRDARIYYGSKENAGPVAANAIVINSVIGKLIANFSIGLNKATTPVKIFTSLDEAKKWLKQFVNEDHQ